MIVMFTLWGLVATLLGFGFFASARSAVHEIQATLCLLTAALSLGCAAILHEIRKSRKPIIDLTESQ